MKEKKALIQSMKGLIVSCQTQHDDPIYTADMHVKMAEAAKWAGAVGIRANSPEQIRDIKAAVDLPVIGLWKIWNDNTDVFITPTLEACKAVWEAGADIIALDCTSQINAEGRPAWELLPEVKKAIPEEAAKQYVPFGCTEFVIQGKSTGTPNICINLLKLLTIYMNEGIDPMDGMDKSGDCKIPPVSTYQTFEAFFDGYKKFLDYYLDLSVHGQYRSYEIMNEHVSFMFTSILMDDCIGRGKALLDGGVQYLGGTNETYGNINTSDSLMAIKDLVFDQKKYTLEQLSAAVLANFNGYEDIRKDCLACDKYGNDLDTADEMANELYEFVAKGVRDRGIAKGMQYFMIVISNNQLNTEWGLQTAASPDGRLSGMYLNPANNPQGGADKSGPTAMLNSLAKFDARFHAGSVQNIKFSPTLFNQNRELIKALMKTYFFKKGGCHLMVTVVDKATLEDAVEHPEKYPNLIVRVSGFSAVFVNLTPEVQQELLSRVTYDEERCGIR